MIAALQAALMTKTAMKVLKNIDDIGIVRFSEKDVVRHKLVQDIVKAYDKYYEEGKKRHHE